MGDFSRRLSLLVLLPSSFVSLLALIRLSQHISSIILGMSDHINTDPDRRYSDLYPSSQAQNYASSHGPGYMAYANISDEDRSRSSSRTPTLSPEISFPPFRLPHAHAHGPTINTSGSDSRVPVSARLYLDYSFYDALSFV